jgi:DnaJ-domain-containing protein 1
MQKTEPAAVCTFRRRTWWWYKLDFYTSPEDWTAATAAEAIRRLADHAEGGKPIRVDERYYARVLGLRGKVTLQDIKSHYRQRMLEYHPDKVASLGAKLRELAEEETKQINAAYEYFCEKYDRST